MNEKPIWWDFCSNEERMERLCNEVTSLKTQLQEMRIGNDPLNVKTRGRILEVERQIVELRKQVDNGKYSN